jgi:AraC-like DNA-binding protein
MNPDQTFSFTDEEFMRSLNDLIEVNISDSGLNEESIIVKLGLTRDLMRKKMEGLMGTNLSDYLNGIRIETVKSKLSNTDDGLDTIARETGFSSIEAMSKAFKHETGKNVFSVRKE